MSNPMRPDGPIPGANFTSDTRNWPWHRPPDITTLDEAIEYVTKDLNEDDDGLRYMSMLEAGVPITIITDIIVTKGIGRGKWTPDFAILSAGPVARVLMIMAKAYNIDYQLGIDEELIVPSPNTLREFAGDPTLRQEEEPKETAKKEKEEVEEGFMSMASEDEQNAMLGYDEEEVEDV